MRLHAEALFTHDAAGDIVRVNEPNGVPAPRFFLGRTTHGVVFRFRTDVEHDVCREIEAAILPDANSDDPLAPLTSVSRYAGILARSAPVVHAETGPAFVFPDRLVPADDAIRVTDDNADLLRLLLPAWLPDVRLSRPLFVSVADAHAVAVCASVRQTADAYEAGVETTPSYRGRGYAARVATAWARAVRDVGRVPLYSTSWANSASLAVARKLGLVQFGSDLHVT